MLFSVDKLLLNKKLLIIVGVFLLLILAGIFFLFLNKKSSSPTVSVPFEQSLEFPTITPEELGMVVTLRPDKKAIKFQIKNYKDIKRIEYTISYNKELDGEVVPEGILGEMNIAEDGITVTDYREFGTCSSGVCRYDRVVSDPKIILKVTKKNGKTYQAEKDVSLK